MKLIFLLIAFAFSVQLKAQAPAPKLVVGIVVDQMTYDYLYRFYGRFSENGFKKLMTKGANVRNCTYNYVPTFTGPGHASIYTGTTPANHGIVANDWFYREFGREVNCVDDTTVSAVGGTGPIGQCSPYFLRANTITDQLRLTYPNSKVIGISLKDRSAILPAGHLSNGSYWYDYASGKFITSTFYKQALPLWLENWLIKNPASKYMKPWTLLKDSSSYEYYTQDNSPYEALYPGKITPTFPYDFSSLPIATQLETFTATPFANTYLTDFGMAQVMEEQLGRDNTTDFLTISYSTPDIAGHAFGPYSLEMEDMYLRLDLEIARLIAFLEKEVGKNQFTLFLTADHAVVPVPQYLADRKLPGGYLFTAQKTVTLNADCKNRFGINPVSLVTNNNVYLTDEALASEARNEIELFIQDEIMKWPEVKAVFRSSQLQSGNAGNNWLDMVQRGYDFQRSGELIFLTQPGFLVKGSDNSAAHKGTSHGSAFNYDTHVPCLFYGFGVEPGQYFEPHSITDIAATLVHIINVQRPNAMTGSPITEILKH